MQPEQQLVQPTSSPSPPEVQLVLWEEEPSSNNSIIHCNTSGWAWFGSITGSDDNVTNATKLALNKLSGKLIHFNLIHFF